MTILVIGATGRVGRQVVNQLLQRGAKVRALTRDPSKADFPAEVEVAHGDMLNIDALRGALSGVSALFLLNAVTSEEFSETAITLGIAKEMGVSRVVYMSVLHADRSINVPHFLVKLSAEQILAQTDFSATILRPAYFFDNDIGMKDAIFKHGVYPAPIGSKGMAIVDVRDIAEVAAIELIRRSQAPGRLPTETINLVGPDTLTGSDVAAIWSEVLGRSVVYGGSPGGFEQSVAAFVPKWLAFELRLMADHFFSDGMLPEPGDVERMTRILGRPPRPYRDFATEFASQQNAVA